jgi:CRISPR-associated protein Cas2
VPTVRTLDVLVAYDVSTETPAGKRRLRKVATICSGYGQRVQNSVFECRVSPAQFEELEARLLAIVDLGEDRLRLYELPGDYAQAVRIHGLVPEHDLKQALIV